MTACEAHLKDLSQKLYTFQKENVLCDTVLIADDCQVWAHSIVLAAVSPYVYKHFLLITQNKAKYRFSLKLPGCEAACVRAVLHFIYTGSLVLPANFQKPETFTGILLVCEKLGVNVTKLNGATVRFVEVVSYENPLESNGYNTELNETIVDTCDLDSEDKTAVSMSHHDEAEALLNVNDKDGNMSSVTAQTSEFFKDEEISRQEYCEVVDIKLEMDVYEQVLNCADDLVSIERTGEDLDVHANSSDSNSKLIDDDVNLSASERICENVQSNWVWKQRVVRNSVGSQNASVRIASKILRNTLQKRRRQTTSGFRRMLCSDPLPDSSPLDGCSGDGIRCRLKKYETEDLTCPKCGKTFKWHSDFRKHMETFQEHSALTCRDCGKVLSCRRQLLAHEKLHLGRRLHGCPTCGKVYRYRSGLVMHSYVHTGHFPYLCDLCGAGFKNFFAMEQHKKRRHSTYRPFVCQECGKGFIRNVLLLRHMTLHSGEKLNICPKCGMSFSFSGNLSRHLRSHDGVKPHSCKICGRGFNRIDHLQNHLVTHSRKKTAAGKFACAECGKTFKTLWLLNRHGLVHSDNNLYSCNTCRKRFTGATRLKQHMVIHEEKQFACPVCKRTFSYERFLTAHMKKIHDEASVSIKTGSLH